MEHSEDIPQAKLDPRRAPYASRIWLLTIACLVLAVGLVLYSSRAKGILIVVSFENGHGVSAGDRLKYRGIDVGEIVSVELGDELQQVDVSIEVEQAAQGAARLGSLFWIERPVVGLAEVRGLETLFGGTHVAVLPGPHDAKPQYEFVGLEIAPTGELPEGGLEILLEAPRLGGLARGVPIKYRGMKIGHVVSVGLASDAASVEARGFILPNFRRLICTNSKFWNHGGLDLSLGITGLQIEADSLTSIAFGGVEVATPSPPGENVSTGQRFSIFDEPLDEWLDAQPSLSASVDMLPAGKSLPAPVRVAKLWKERTFGIKRNRQRTGWLISLTDGRLVGPADLLVPVNDAVDDETVLEMAGSRIPVTDQNVTRFDHLAIFALGEEFALPSEAWPIDRIRVPDQPEDCLLVAESGSPQVLSVARLTTSDLGWQINMATPIDTDLHGASVVAMSDGSLVGFLIFEDGRALVAIVSHDLASK